MKQQTNFISASYSTLKFYLSKNKKYQKYYVIISHYDPQTKKTTNKYKSLKTGNKQTALYNFNQFINNYFNSNNETETVLDKNITMQDFFLAITNQLRANLNPNTVSIYNLSVRKFVELVKNKMLRLITNSDIENFKILRLQQNIS